MMNCTGMRGTWNKKHDHHVQNYSIGPQMMPTYDGQFIIMAFKPNEPKFVDDKRILKLQLELQTTHTLSR